MSKRGAALIVVLACVVASWIALRRSDPIAFRRGLDEQQRLTQQWLQESQEAFKAIPFTPLAELRSPTDVRSVLAAMDFRDPPRLLPRDELLDRLSEFIYYRLVAHDLKGYKDWRRSHGYELTALAEMVEHFAVDWTFQLYCGRPLPPGATSEDVFDSLWQPVIDAFEGAGKPVSIASGPAGLTAVFGVVSAFSPDRKNVAGLIPEELWRGGTGAYSPNWWRPPLRDEELFKRHKQIHYAEAGLILEYANKVRRPLVMTWYWDPQRGAWRLEYVNMYNYAGTVPVLVY